MICQLGSFDFVYTVIPLYMCGVSDYMFTAEFINTSFALKKTVKGLEISTSDFVKSRQDKKMFGSGQKKRISNQSSFEIDSEHSSIRHISLQEEMDIHLKDSKRK